MVDIMQKQTSKLSLKEKFTYALACCIALLVFLLSVHAKDLFRYHETENARKVGYSDISKKAVGELHNHIDKQMVKTFDKSTTGDTVIASARSRNDVDMLIGEEDPGLWGRLQEAWLLASAYASLALKI